MQFVMQHLAGLDDVLALPGVEAVDGREDTLVRQLAAEHKLAVPCALELLV